MVDFNRPIASSNDPNYLSYSKGYESPKSDKTWATLFSGISDLGEQAVKGIDASIKEKGKEETRKEFDDLNGRINDPAVTMLPNAIQLDKGGVAPAGTISSVDSPNASPAGKGVINPTAMTEFRGNMEKISEALQQGKMTPTYYWTQAEALARQLRAKYPGYRDEIDAEIHRITGATPANALRTHLLNDIATAQSNADQAEKDWQKYVKDKAQIIYNKWPEYDAMVAAGKGPSKLEVRQEVGTKEARDYRDSVEKTNLALKSARNEDASADAEALFVRMANDISNKSLQRGTESFGLGDIQEQIEMISARSVSGGANITPEEQQKITASLNIYRNTLEATYNKLMHSPLSEGSPETFASIIARKGGPNRTKDLIAQSMSSVDNIISMVTNKELGLIAMSANIAKASEDEAKAIALKDPFFKVLSTLRSIGGEAVAAEAKASMPNYSQKLSQSIQGLLDHKWASMVTGVNPSGGKPQTLGDHIQEIKRVGVKDPETYNELLRRTTLTLVSDKATPEMKANLVRALFSPENNKVFAEFKTPESKMEVFLKLSSPAVNKQMEKLRETQPDLYELYKQWTVDKANGLINRTAQDIQKVVVAPDTDYKISWNPETYEYSVQYTGPKGTAPLSPSSSTFASNYLATLERKVKDINKMIAIVAPIAKANGADMNQEMLNLTRLWGVDHTAGKEKTVLEKLGKAIFDRTVTPVPAKGGKSIFDGVTGNPTEPTGNAGGEDIKHEGGRVYLNGYEKLNTIEPNLQQALNKAAAYLPEGITARVKSGLREGDPRHHGNGIAADITLVGPDGKDIPDYQTGKNFRLYEQYAHKVKEIVDKEHPEIGDRLRWGGYFSGPKNLYGALDLMHFDVSGGGMAGGDWKNGLTPAQRKLWPDAVSQGMETKKVDTSKFKSLYNDGSFDSPSSGLIGEDRVNALRKERALGEELKNSPLTRVFRQSQNVIRAGRWDQKALDAITERELSEEERTRLKTIEQRFFPLERLMEFYNEHKEETNGTTPKSQTKNTRTPEASNIEDLYTKTQQFIRTGLQEDWVKLEEEFKQLQKKHEIEAFNTSTNTSLWFKEKSDILKEIDARKGSRTP